MCINIFLIAVLWWCIIWFIWLHLVYYIHRYVDDNENFTRQYCLDCTVDFQRFGELSDWKIIFVRCSRLIGSSVRRKRGIWRVMRDPYWPLSVYVFPHSIFITFALYVFCYNCSNGISREARSIKHFSINGKHRCPSISKWFFICIFFFNYLTA